MWWWDCPHLSTPLVILNNPPVASRQPPLPKGAKERTIPQSLRDSPPYLPTASNVLGNAEDNSHKRGQLVSAASMLHHVIFANHCINVLTAVTEGLYATQTQ